MTRQLIQISHDEECPQFKLKKISNKKPNLEETVPQREYSAQIITFQSETKPFEIFVRKSKKITLSRIMPNLDPKNGKSSYFNTEKLKSADMSNPENVFLMFLPSFSMLTPFHVMAIKEEYKQFNKIASQLDEQAFENFFCQKKYLDKIKSMFVYTLENVYSFEANAIEKFYCQLDLDVDEEEDADEEDEEFITKTRQNTEKIESYMLRIKDYILSDSKFIKHRSLIVY